MRRREFVAFFGASITWPFAALAQQAGRTYRLGFLVLAPRGCALNVQFLDELRRLGFVEGQNLTVEFRAHGLHPDLVSQYAAELVKGTGRCHRNCWGGSNSRRSRSDENHSYRNCFGEHGAGLGLGVGQLYRHESNGRWLLVPGEE